MKTLELKEAQALYDVETYQKETWRDPIILTQDGKRVAVILSIEEYDEYALWRSAHQVVGEIERAEERTLEDIVADIKRLGPSQFVSEPTSSLKELLENSPHDSHFNLAEWQAEWDKINAEIEADDEREDS